MVCVAVDCMTQNDLKVSEQCDVQHYSFFLENVLLGKLFLCPGVRLFTEYDSIVKKITEDFEIVQLEVRL